MRTHLFPAFLLGLALLASSANAQTFDSPSSAAAAPTIHGLVLDEDGQPLPGATIMIQGTKQVYSTNAEGQYSFPSAAAAQAVQVAMAGYTEAKLTLRRGSPNAVTLQLLPGTRIRQGGKHHGQLIAVGQAPQD